LIIRGDVSTKFLIFLDWIIFFNKLSVSSSSIFVILLSIIIGDNSNDLFVSFKVDVAHYPLKNVYNDSISLVVYP